MKNKHFWSVLACTMILVGFGVGLVSCILMGFDFSKLNISGEAKTNTHDINESFDSIYIDTSVADITFKASTDDKVKVVCEEREKHFHEVKVESGTLKIVSKSDRKWYEWLAPFNFNGKETVTIYLPKSMAEGKSWKLDGSPAFALKDLTIDTSTGDTTLENLYVEGTLKVDSSTGHLTCTRVQAGSVIVDHSTGNVEMDQVITDKLKIETSTGDVKFTNGDSPDVKIDTSTGDIFCSFLSDKKVTADTSTGDIKIPQVSTGQGGTCRLDTSTGDITVEYVTK